MPHHYYGLTFTQTVVAPTTSIPLDLATIDATIGDVVMTFEGVAPQFPLNMARIDAVIGDTFLTFAGPQDADIFLNTARVDAIIGDVPMTFASGTGDEIISLNLGIVDATVADVPLEFTAAGVGTLTLHAGQVDAVIFDVPLEILPPNTQGIGLNTAVIDAVVADVPLDFEPLAAQTITLNTATIDATIADVPLELNTIGENTISLNLATIDATIADVSIEYLPPDTEQISLNVARIDANIADVSIEFLAPDDEQISLNVARIDATIADVTLAFLPPDAESIPLNAGRIDATIADTPMTFDAEAAGFNGSGLLKGPTSNYATTESTGVVMLWIKVPVTVAEDRRITFAANAGSTPRIQFFVESDIAGTQVLGIETDDGTVTQTFFFEPDQDIFDGNKHMIAYRGNGTSYDILIDGQIAAGTPAGQNSGKWFDIQQTAGTDFNQLQIGGFAEPGQNVEFFFGTIDELVHVGEWLSDPQILSLWNSSNGATIPEMTGASWWESVNSAYELAKTDTKNWGDDYLGANNLTEDPAGFLVAGDKLVNGGWTP